MEGATRYPTCDIDLFRRGGGGNSRCRWLDHDTEMDIVKKHCYWRSPLCREGVRTERSSGGDSDMGAENSGHSEHSGNVCLREDGEGKTKGGDFCWDRERFNLMRWPLCLHHSHCDPYMSIALIRSKFRAMQLPRRSGELSFVWPQEVDNLDLADS
jgi:hypothetical protein